MHVEKLVMSASAALSESTPEVTGECALLAGRIRPQLEELLERRNGFYAFSSALHVFPAVSSFSRVGLEQWNAPELWRAEYGASASGALFFAQDLVGGQFCIADDAVHKFDPETGERTHVADSIEEWAFRVLGDETQTLWPLAEEWYRRYGDLKPGQRLAPKVPFVLGGEFALENLYAAEAPKLMRYYASLARQLHDLPDGAQVELRVID